jgi:hypothetical protein
MQECYSVSEIILEEAEEATLQLLPAKSGQHYEKVFSEFNEWKEKRRVIIAFLTFEEEVCNFIHVVEVLDAEGRYKGL